MGRIPVQVKGIEGIIDAQKETIDYSVKISDIENYKKDKKLILTTRTYIYNNSKQLFYKFYHATGIKDEYLIDVANYNYAEKGSILYNHLKKNNILGTVNYTQIINHRFYEDIKIINSEIFEKAIDMLSISFVKITFNEEDEKE